MIQTQHRRAGTHWFVSDGFIFDGYPPAFRREGGRPLECSSKLFIYNPQTTPASVTARFYHPDRPLTAVSFVVEAGAIAERELSALPEVPHGQSFWIALESDQPVLPQARHEDFTFWESVPDAIVAIAPYPGPLTDEKNWVFPDCYQGAYKGWHEQEVMTILNPNLNPATVRIRYLHRSRNGGAEETITIPGERVAQLNVWERQPSALGDPNGVPVKVLQDYAVRLDADAPILAQTTRRCRWEGFPSVVGSRSTMPIPLRAETPQIWHYPGGEIVDTGTLPRDPECDCEWNLLFTNNLSETKTTRAALTFHQADGAATEFDIKTIAPLKSDLRWLHLPPFAGAHTARNVPYALTVTSENAVTPGVCLAEFENWSNVCPGAMAAIPLYPPLTEETVWWLGIGHAGGADDAPAEWGQTYHFFNPNDREIAVTVTFLGLSDGERTAQLRLGAGAAARLLSSEIADLPHDAAFAVRADSDAPFCAQVTGRSFTRGPDADAGHVLVYRRPDGSVGGPMNQSQENQDG